MEKYSLKKLNSDGQLILFYKKVAFVCNCSRHPEVYDDRPITCYVHFYKNAYIVTDHILKDRQKEYHDFADAQNAFIKLIENSKDVL